MVDHIHFPKSVAPLFPTEKIKKIRRRKDKQQEAAFRESLEKEKKNSDEPDEEDKNESGVEGKRAAAVRRRKTSDSNQLPADNENGGPQEVLEPEKRIDVHV